jgi:hypothetical protein
VTKFFWFLLAAAMPLAAQWLDHPDGRTPRTTDGKPNLTAPAPRANGKPDLSGVWQAERSPARDYAQVMGRQGVNLQVDLTDLSIYAINLFWGVKSAQEPLTPEGRAVLQRNLKSGAYPPSQCLPTGIPSFMLIYAFKIIQTPRETVMISETGDPARQIYTDGRSLPKDPDPSWVGYSVGKWDGDTFVIETNGTTERSWLDGLGHPRSDAMHISERYRRRDFGHLDLEVTFADPKYYTRAFTMKTALTLIPDSDVLEFVCTENEKDRRHIGQN